MLQVSIPFISKWDKAGPDGIVSGTKKHLIQRLLVTEDERVFPMLSIIDGNVPVRHKSTRSLGKPRKRGYSRKNEILYIELVLIGA
jgi:hypothetical protein